MQHNVYEILIPHLKKVEGFRSKPYNDGYGNLTIGYGHLILPNEKCVLKELTEEQATALLITDLDARWLQFQSIGMNDLYWTYAQYSSLLSILFNCGIGNFKKTKLYKHCIEYQKHIDAEPAGNHDSYIENILIDIVSYCTVRGSFSQGLANRRKLEYNLFKQKSL